MSAVLYTIFVHHPLEHSSTAFVVEVGVDIGQRYTVGVEETLKQQVILQRVDACDAEAVCHHTACRGASSGANPYAQLVAGGVDEVLHYQKVAGEAHRLHHSQLIADALVHLVGHGVAVQALCPFVCQIREVVILRFKALRQRKLRHQRRAVEAVRLHLVEYLARVGQRLRHIGEDGVHLLACLKPLLLSVEHTCRVVEVLAGGEAQQVIVRLGVILVHEVAVVGAYHLDAILLGQLQ